MPARFRRLERATDVAGLPRAFRPEPLQAEDMAEFYSDALDKCRHSRLLRRLKDELIETVEDRFFFKGVLYGNRGVGKSTEINRLLDDPDVKNTFLVVRLDALNDLNPQTFSVVDVLLLLLANLIQTCEEKCREIGTVFHEASIMEADLQPLLAPFFKELRAKEESSKTVGGGAEFNLVGLVKLNLRAEGQRKKEAVADSQTLAGLSAAIDRYVDVLKGHLPEFELLVIGENFDKEQIPPTLLEDTFVQYASLLRELRLHMLFTLPVPFVYAFGPQLAFRAENRFPIYDIPVFDIEHGIDSGGDDALKELIERRADYRRIFAEEALQLLLRASGGDLYRLFALIVNASRFARYRREDLPETEARVVLKDAQAVVGEQLGVFRNELGTGPNDADDIPWETKLKKLRDIYEAKPEANVPDKTLYQLLRKRAVLFFNGKGRYAAHPLAVEILLEQLKGDPTFVYRGGGLTDPSPEQPKP